MREQETIYDVIIIGGGPAGLTAAQYTARGRLRPESACAAGHAGESESTITLAFME